MGVLSTLHALRLAYLIFWLPRIHTIHGDIDGKNKKYTPYYTRQWEEEQRYCILYNSCYADIKIIHISSEAMTLNSFCPVQLFGLLVCIALIIEPYPSILLS